jgi:hypothetical protein
MTQAAGVMFGLFRMRLSVSQHDRPGKERRRQFDSPLDFVTRAGHVESEWLKRLFE